MIGATCDVWNIDFKEKFNNTLNKNSNNIKKKISTGIRSSITKNRRQFPYFNNIKKNCSTGVRSSLT